MDKLKWKTFRGKEVSLDTVDHQHLSNCYWYQKVILNVEHKDLSFIIDMLEERFNGQLLPYRPHLQFKLEITFLEEGGYIKLESLGSMIRKIWFRGSCIGEIIDLKRI